MNQRRTAEEWRQAEEAHLRSKYIEYELNQRQEGSGSDNDISQSFGKLFHSIGMYQ
jgi:hypothetical protein